MTFISKTQHADVVLIGGGIMSATLGAFIKQLEPTWTISMFERLGEAAWKAPAHGTTQAPATPPCVS